jgi:pre-mRNA-splicing factor CWC22
LENEERYAEIKKEILGDSEDEEESGSEGSYDDSEEEDGDVAPEKAGITDMTETNLINLRRTIYLTIMNSVCSNGTHMTAKLMAP